MENTIDNARAWLKRIYPHGINGVSMPGLAQMLHAYAASVKPDGWRVKELEWKHDDEFDIYDARPLGDLIRYRIVDDFFLFIGDNDKSTEYPTLDLAKAAAEADYMERIGMALESA